MTDPDGFGPFEQGTPADEWEDKTRGLRDWPEDFSHENGNYFCRCCICKAEFRGHKRRVVCKCCSATSQFASGEADER